MKTTRALLAALLVALTAQAGVALAGEAQEQVVTKAGTNPSVAGSPKYFTGSVRLDPVLDANRDAPYSVCYVTFEPGARTFWHTHPAGQRLIVVSGYGLTATWDGQVQTLKPGDAVWCPPDVKHWHGASPTTGMTHLALTGTKDGKNVTWMEEVTIQQYGAR